MIRSLLNEQRGDLLAFADGLTEWVRGGDSLAAEAAACNVASVLTLIGNHLTENKWSR